MKRKKQRRFNPASLPLLLGGAALLMGCLVFGWEAFRLNHLSKQGVTVQARLLRKDQSVYRNRVSYRVHYQFEAAGRTYSGSGEVSSSFQAAWEAADRTIAVKYFQDNPSFNGWDPGLTEEANRTGGMAGGLAVFGCLVLALGAGAAFLSREQFERWMYWDQSP
jgi:hypothetical protein